MYLPVTGLKWHNTGKGDDDDDDNLYRQKNL
jgi:hypothetical protein